MIDILFTIALPSRMGRAHFLRGGTIMIQQGRPFGVMAQPGEAMLSLEDMQAIDKMVGDAVATGWKPDPPGTIRPL
jgi:hypothetical protein